MFSKFALTSLALALAFLSSSAIVAQTVDLLPSDINLGDTTTSVFSDGALTLTPFIGDTQDTFNANAVRLGIDDNGSNNNAFNDPDTDPTNGNEERLIFDFEETFGLTRIAYDFSRADGPGDSDGVIISGFLSDPGVTFSLDDPDLFSVYDDVNGTVRLNIPGSLFDGNDIDVNFDVAASAGQTLELSVTDTTQAGAQFAITGISYSAVPEPAAATTLALLGLVGLCFRRRD